MQLFWKKISKKNYLKSWIILKEFFFMWIKIHIKMSLHSSTRTMVYNIILFYDKCNFFIHLFIEVCKNLTLLDAWIVYTINVKYDFCTFWPQFTGVNIKTYVYTEYTWLLGRMIAFSLFKIQSKCCSPIGDF